MRHISRIFFGLSCLLPSLAYAGQSEISTSMDRLAKNLVSVYQGNGGHSGEKIAVFEFSTSQELRQKRVGFAVSELLTHHIANNSDFIVLERLQLQSILAELKVSMSGAVDPDDALRAGKLGGAKLLVLGSVERFGAKYHINARIVETETGRVSATAYESLPVRVFEEEAKEYIAYVPEVQRIGLYFLYNWRHNAGLPYQTISYTNYLGMPFTQSVNPASFNLSMTGIGVRYSVSRKLVLDFSTMKAASQPEAGHDAFASPTDSSEKSYTVNVKAYRFLIGGKAEILRSLYGYFGLGTSYYLVSVKEKTEYLTPTLQFRTEYFPQNRIGISVAVNYDLVSRNAWQRELAYTLDERIGSSKRVRLSKLSIEPTISLYF